MPNMSEPHAMFHVSWELPLLRLHAVRIYAVSHGVHVRCNVPVLIASMKGATAVAYN